MYQYCDKVKMIPLIGSNAFFEQIFKNKRSLTIENNNIKFFFSDFNGSNRVSPGEKSFKYSSLMYVCVSNMFS